MKPDAKHAGKLQGKVALITGGNSGIGLASCWVRISDRDKTFSVSNHEWRTKDSHRDRRLTRHWSGSGEGVFGARLQRGGKFTKDH